MKINSMVVIIIGIYLMSGVFDENCNAKEEVQLPEGVKAIWDLEKAYIEKTATRERICLNGLWRWQPSSGKSKGVPRDNWGYFKVPGPWPGISSYFQKDSQRVYPSLKWKEQRMRDVSGAWYQREMLIPREWGGRRIVLSAEYLHSYAEVYVDDEQAGEIRFPGGEVDLTALCRAGSKHLLSMFVAALPLKEIMRSYNDTASAKEIRGAVARRGLCGDVYLEGMPSGPRIVDIKIETSVRKGTVTFEARLQGLNADGKHLLHARIIENGTKKQKIQEFNSGLFRKNDLKEGRLVFVKKWNSEKLWDIHTPQNLYHLQLTLLDAENRVLDIGHPVRFGFREFWIEGRDFFLNGSRIFLSSVPLDNVLIGAAQANYSAAKETLVRLKSFGINFVYTHNYGCEPGSHLGFGEILRAADDVGMLVSFSQPHFGHYEWLAFDADESNGYARHAEFYVRMAQNHPSVVMYSMSHNATGYSEDMNPDLIDGINDARDKWSFNNARLALRAEAIVKRLDSSRIIYHHSSGNLGSMHTSNFYPNFVPIQEMSDWFEHWATRGVKPFFTCEYSAPLTWDWTMYRGWYKGKRAFGQAKVPWEFCLAEWNSQFLGDRAFQISEREKENLRWEAKQFRAGNLWTRWDYPYHLNSSELDERYPIFARYLTDNWRAFRTWGVSIVSPWIYWHFWKLREGVDRGRKEFKTDWENLQQPGFSPDFEDERYEQMDMAYERSDWIPTPVAHALIRNNMPLLAYIGGKPARFTSKDHNFWPGETVEKQIVVINNSRKMIYADCEWSFELPQAVNGAKNISVKTGGQECIPLRFGLPENLSPGVYRLNVIVKFNGGETQKDSFPVHVLPSAASPIGTGVFEINHKTRESATLRFGHKQTTETSGPASVKIALYDPKGETGQLLKILGVRFRPVEAKEDLAAFDILIIGKNALTMNGVGPSVNRVRGGLKAIVFEQTSEVLEKRFGFRITEHGLRQVFRRVIDHPILTGIGPEHLCDWRGEATILPARLKYELSRNSGDPAIRWCDIEVTRVWRCGNRGNVASVLIEKPARGDFLPIVDGGFSLQYSPLMEYREGDGMILFCQMDVTGRTETDPAAVRMVENIIQYVSVWKPSPTHKAVYIGDQFGKNHLDSAGINTIDGENATLTAEHVLIVGPDGGKKLASRAAVIKDLFKMGGGLLAIGLDETEANAFLPMKVQMKKMEHISAFFETHSRDSLFAGIGPADLHSRDPRDLPLVSGDALIVGNGILARAEKAKLAFCQLAPWQFDQKKQNTKRTYRRASFLVSRLLANMGIRGSTPLLQRFSSPAAKWEKRWLEGLYLDIPEEWDDPYRFFRW